MMHAKSRQLPSLAMRSRAKSKVLLQQGQALVEGLVVLLALMSLWVGVSWLARFQDMALQASHASRYAAFSLSRNLEANIENDMRRHFFSGPAHQWSDRRGKRLLSSALDEIDVQTHRQTALAVQAQPGGALLHAQALRQDWRLDDTGVLAVQLSAAPRLGLASLHNNLPADGLAYFDSQNLLLQRHTSLLTGAGHAADDMAVQQTVANSSLAWSNSANSSYVHGKKIASAMTAVDAGWGRPQPVFDWLEPWSGHVPESHLRN
ncbi:pilus assembly protein [Alcaligenaceae bacterium]|nr:pilus assembly protein [Alcaligenaceae bacterium]